MYGYRFSIYLLEKSAMDNKTNTTNGWWKGNKNLSKITTGLAIIILAVLLLESLSAAQYYLTRELMEDELEKRAETELTTKAILTKGIIDDSEHSLKSHIMEIKRNLDKPEMMGNIMAWALKYSPHVMGCGIAFEPGYYHKKDSLFEPYALKTDTGIRCMQIAGADFDYTKVGFFRYIKKSKTNNWVGPYDDAYLKLKLITYAVPIYEFSGDTVAVYGIDINCDTLGTKLNKNNIYPSSFDFLLSEQGELIAGPTDPKMKRKVDNAIRIINDSTILKHGIKDGCIHITYYHDDVEGQDLTLFLSQMRDAPHWRIAVVCYDDEVYAPLKKLHYRLLLISLFAFGIMLFIIWIFARNEGKLKQKTIQEQRMAGELRVANLIQQSMLPRQYYQQDEVKVYGSLVPAREVGGDLFDYFICDEKLFFCIGDVSGKGASSAMLMGVTHSMFRAFSAHEKNPSRIMQSINEASCKNNEANMFVTLFIGILDLPTGRLRYCDAGHDAPIILPNMNPIPVDPHLPIGVFEDVKYKVQELMLEPESTIFLYTDGLTEAKNNARKMFGLESVKDILAKYADKQPKEIIEIVSQEVNRYVGDAEQSDDLTMLAIRYTPKQFESMFSETLVIKNDIHEVAGLNTFQKSVYAKLGIEKSMVRKLQLAVEEAVVNVIDYAYPIDTEGDIEVRMMSDGQNLKIVIIDSGVFFDPTTKEKADTTLSAQERQIGGLGLLLVRELMDTINYEREEGKNILTLIKKYNNENNN